MYTTNNIFLVLPVNFLINQDGEPIIPHKLSTCTKPSSSKLRFLFCPRRAQKETTQVDGKVILVCHQLRKVFWVIFDGIPKQQKGYFFYIPSTLKNVFHMTLHLTKTFLCISIHDAYSESLVVLPVVLYIPDAADSHEQNGDIITFSHFEEGNLVEN